MIRCPKKFNNSLSQKIPIVIHKNLELCLDASSKYIFRSHNAGKLRKIEK